MSHINFLFQQSSHFMVSFISQANQFSWIFLVFFISLKLKRQRLLALTQYLLLLQKKNIFFSFLVGLYLSRPTPSRHLTALIQNESETPKLRPWLRERVFQPYYCVYSSPPHLSFRFMKCKGCAVSSRQTPRRVFKLDHIGGADATRIPMDVDVKAKTRRQRLT